MKKTNKTVELSNLLSSRYGLEKLNFEDWREIELFGGMGMDMPTFNAIADAAIACGDSQVTVYELESTKVEFLPVSIQLDFASFNHLKGNAISHFNVAMLPPSRAWAALLTNDVQTFVYGPPNFLLDVVTNAPKLATD